MASFLSLVAGVVIGLVGGWFLRGMRAGSTQPTDSTTSATTTATPQVATAPAAAATEAEAEQIT